MPRQVKAHFVNRPIRKKGPSSSADFNSSMHEIAVDHRNFAQAWNQDLYPILTSLPQGAAESRWTLTNNIWPLQNGLDGANVFVSNSVTSGTFWDTSSARPFTIMESLLDVHSDIDALRSLIDALGALPSGTQAGNMLYWDGAAWQETDRLTFSSSTNRVSMGQSGTDYTFPAARGLNGQVLETDASGGVSWATISGTLPSGAANQTLYHDGLGWLPTSVLQNNGTNITTTGTLTVGAYTVPNTDGSSGQVLATNGSGAVTWQNISGSPGGATTNIQFNNASAFGGDANLTWDNTNKEFSITGSAAYSPLNVKDNGGNEILTVENGGNVIFGNITGATSYEFPAADGSANQILESDGAGTLTWVDNNIIKQGRIALATTDTSKAVSFTTAFSSTNYVVTACIEYLGGGAGDTPSVFATGIDDRDVNGFLVLFSGAIDTPGPGTYYLHWTARAD